MTGRRYRAVAATLRDVPVEGPWQSGEGLPAQRLLAGELDDPRATACEAPIVPEVKGRVEVRRMPGDYATMWQYLGTVSERLMVVSVPEITVPAKSATRRKPPCGKGLI